MLALTLMCVILFINVTNVSAASSTPKTNNILTFQSVDTQTGLVNPGLSISNGLITPFMTRGYIFNNVGYIGTNLVVSRAMATSDANLSKVFVKYLTTSWAKASSYTWSESNSVGWSISPGATFDVADTVRVSLNLSASRTTTYGVAITIPASSTKYSKLGFASDFFKQSYLYEYIVDGNIVISENSYINTPTVNSYLIVYYQ